ncbi:MAG: hypothetical protein VYB98_00300, partial [Actinomycetota bacterium]|nr:hypothetical protein [Actinomycetota bacterium]
MGTAGGFGSRGACVGDVFLSTKCVFHARRIPDGSTRGTLEEFGFGHYRSPMALVNKIARVAGIKAG